MAVTVKTVKKKPLALKKNIPDASVEGAEGVDAEGAGASPAAGSAVAASMAAKASAPVKKASYTFAGICAILVFLMFSAILALQIIEWQFYHEPKSAFPPFGTLIPIPGGASVSSVPVVVDSLDQPDALVDDGAEVFSEE